MLAFWKVQLNIEFSGSTPILTFLNRSLCYYQSVHEQTFCKLRHVCKFNINLKNRIFTYSLFPSSSYFFGFSTGTRQRTNSLRVRRNKQCTCLQKNTLNRWSQGKEFVLFFRTGISMLPERNPKISRGNNTSCFPKDQRLSVFTI